MTQLGRLYNDDNNGRGGERFVREGLALTDRIDFSGPYTANGEEFVAIGKSGQRYTCVRRNVGVRYYEIEVLRLA